MKNITRRHAIALLAAGLPLSTARADEHFLVGRKASTLETALTWLIDVDANDYGRSWQGTAAHFKNIVTRDQWTSALQRVRVPLGKVISRQILSSDYRTELPGAPDGHYVVIRFETNFQNKKSGIETVTPMLDADGQWRVAGYFIK